MALGVRLRKRSTSRKKAEKPKRVPLEESRSTRKMIDVDCQFSRTLLRPLVEQSAHRRRSAVSRPLHLERNDGTIVVIGRVKTRLDYCVTMGLANLPFFVNSRPDLAFITTKERVGNEVDHLLTCRREDAKQRVAIVTLGSQKRVGDLGVALVRHLENFLVVVANVAMRNKSKKTRFDSADFFWLFTLIVYHSDTERKNSSMALPYEAMLLKVAPKLSVEPWPCDAGVGSFG